MMDKNILGEPFAINVSGGNEGNTTHWGFICCDCGDVLVDQYSDRRPGHETVMHCPECERNTHHRWVEI